MFSKLVRKEDGNYIVSIEAVGALAVAIGLSLIVVIVGVIVPTTIVPSWYYQQNANTGETELNMIAHLLICAAVVVAVAIGFIMGVNHEK